MEDLFIHVLNISITASFLVLAIILYRLFAKKAPKWVSVLLLGVVNYRNQHDLKAKPIRLLHEFDKSIYYKSYELFFAFHSFLFVNFSSFFDFDLSRLEKRNNL